MTLDALKNKWSEENVSEAVEINEKKLKEITMSKSKKALSDFRSDNLAELVIYLLLMSFLWNFMGDYLTEMKFFIPALILFVLSGINVAFNIYSLDFYGRMNFSSPILDLQRRLQKITLYMKWERYLMIILIPLTIIPFFIVIAQGFAGFDLYPLLSAVSLKIVLPWSVVGTIIVLLISRAESRKLKRISQSLKEIRDFQDEGK